LSPVLYKSAEALNRLTPDAIEGRPFPLRSVAETRPDEYLRYDILTKELVDRLKMDIRRGSPGDVISFFAEQILKKASFPAQFHLLAPVLKEYVTTRLFLESPADLENRNVLERLTDEEVAAALVKRFVDAVNRLAIGSRAAEPVEPEALFRPVSGTAAFQWTGDTYPGRRTVFNLVACDSGLEARLAQFLDLAPDVAAYAKNARQMRFSLEYVSSQGYIRYYYPDFLVRLTNAQHFLLETKGAETVEVARKDARAHGWAADVTRLTGVPWDYLKLPQDVFDRTKAESFEELVQHARALQPELLGTVEDMATGTKVTYVTLTPELVREELAAYEKKYEMSSSEFMRRFEAGELGDHEMMPWEGYCAMAKELGVELH
ncbi:MAG: hypothetical protein ACRDF8_11635, partial [Chloroflexota bacterium]